MINLFWSGLLTVLLLSGCGFDGTPTRHNDFVPLTSIEIVAVPATIAALTSTKLTVNGNFSGQFTRDITDQAVWSSDTPTVAGFVTPTSPSRVTGRTTGTAILTATVGVVSATFKLTVSSAKITTLTITPVNPSIAKGLTTQFKVSGAFSDLTTQDLTFDSTWKSSNPAVATVSDDPGSKGFAQTLAIGTATITATFDGLPGTTQLSVTAPLLQSITVTTATPSTLSLSAASFQATGHYSDGTNPDLTSQVSWASSIPDVATITTTGGVATTLAQGTTSISATLNGVSGATNLKVTGGTLTVITVSPAIVTLVTGTVVRMTATGTFSNGAARDITRVVSWSVANPALATVTAPGGNLAWLNANAIAVKGTTTVTAKYGTVSGTINLTVSAPTPLSITITPPASFVDLTAGTSARFTATAGFSDLTIQDVTASSDWTSSDPAKATVGNIGIAKGRVSGVTAGSATISAVYGGVTVTFPVTVTSRTLSTLAIPSTTFVNSGNNVPFKATATYTDSAGITIKDVTEDTIWTIDKPQVAILADSQNQPGQVVGVDIGSATLTASFGGKTSTVTVTVPQ